MKKNYSKPELSTINVELSQIIAASGGITDSSNGYSGSASGQGVNTQTGGSVDAAEYRNNLWDN